MAAEETIGARLRRLREERGLSQRDIVAPGVSAQYVSKIERGQRTASVKALRKLARNLGVSPEYLENGRDASGSELRAFRLDDAELSLRIGDDQAAAEETLRSVLEDAVAAGDATAETRASLGLGILASHRGDHEEAVALLERAVEKPWVTTLAWGAAYGTLGHSLAACGRTDEAVVLFRSCLDELLAQRPVHDAAVVRFATYLSYELIPPGTRDSTRLVEAWQRAVPAE